MESKFKHADVEIMKIEKKNNNTVARTYNQLQNIWD